MKKIIVNILATTCLTVLSIMTIGLFSYGGFSGLIDGTVFLPSLTFIQVFAVNIIIHCGLFFTRKFESRYAVLEYLLDLSFIIIVLFIFGLIFKWYPDSPWILAIIAVAVYVLGLFTDIVRVSKDISDINALLKKRKEKTAENP